MSKMIQAHFQVSVGTTRVRRFHLDIEHAEEMDISLMTTLQDEITKAWPTLKDTTFDVTFKESEDVYTPLETDDDLEYALAESEDSDRLNIYIHVTSEEKLSRDPEQDLDDDQERPRPQIVVCGRGPRPCMKVIKPIQAHFQTPAGSTHNTRRFSLETEVGEKTNNNLMTQLHAKLTKAWPALKSTAYDITYKQANDEDASMKTEEDLQKALALSENSHRMNIYIHVTDEEAFSKVLQQIDEQKRPPPQIAVCGLRPRRGMKVGTIIQAHFPDQTGSTRTRKFMLETERRKETGKDLMTEFLSKLTRTWPTLKSATFDATLEESNEDAVPLKTDEDLRKALALSVDKQPVNIYIHVTSMETSPVDPKPRDSHTSHPGPKYTVFGRGGQDPKCRVIKPKAKIKMIQAHLQNPTSSSRIRRIHILIKSIGQIESSSVNELHAQITKTWPALDSTSYDVTYKKANGEDARIETDDDLQTAIASSENSLPMNIFIHVLDREALSKALQQDDELQRSRPKIAVCGRPNVPPTATSPKKGVTFFQAHLQTSVGSTQIGKFHLNTENNEDIDNSLVNGIYDRITSALPVLKDVPFDVTYKGSDGDDAPLKSEEDLRRALAFSDSTKPLNIYIQGLSEETKAKVLQDNEHERPRPKIFACGHDRRNRPCTKIVPSTTETGLGSNSKQ